MNVERSAAAADADNPWPGLATFTEEQAGLFYGRTEEIRDLTRRTERNALTVLFGQSGLGKSSLLQAGVFPRLRAAGYWPIYVRLDHGPGAPTPAEQVKTLVQADTQRAGKWTKSGVAVPGESLWEFFHHRDDRLVNAAGKAIVPVLVFDQFEELFTLGAGVGGGAERARAVAFMSDLAELVENRPSEKLVARLEESSAEMDAFDFSRTDYRVVITLREDYLPHLETLKTIMPALMENRMRLARMTGTQALEAVVKPGGALVTEEVARAIVEFVAGAKGGSIERLAELDVEPPLLSVICRELNERRRKLGQAQITADLVSGNRREILTDFYERSVADLPEGMRTFVEDKLLTKSGFRDNLAVETALQEPGVTQVLIDTLVARRLLRIEDRIGVQRVELTHDVLAEVVRAARDDRQQRLLLAKTEERERITRRRMWLARTIAAGLLVGLAGVSWIAWRAIRAERATDALRAQEVVLREREAKLRQEAETRQRAEARRWSRFDASSSARLLEQGRTQEGLAFLVHAGRVDQENPLVAPRLLSALAYRSFAQPYGETITLPVPNRDSTGFWNDFTQDGKRIGVWGSDGVYRLVNSDSGLVDVKINIAPNTDQAWIYKDTVLGLAMNVSCAHYDPATGMLRSLWPGKGSWGGGAISPDGRWLAVKLGREFRIWDVKAGKDMPALPHEEGSTAPVFSDDGSRVATITADRDQIRIWSVPDGKKLAEIVSPAGKNHFNGFRLSHDGRRIAVGQTGGVRLYDAASGEPTSTLWRHDGLQTYTEIPVFTPDDELLLTSSADHTVYVWSVKSGQTAIPPLVHDSYVRQALVVAGGRYLYTRTQGGNVYLWDLTSGQRVIEPLREWSGHRLSISPDGRRLAEVSPAGEIRRMQVEPSEILPLAVPFNEPGMINSFWSADQRSALVRVSRAGVSYFDVAAARDLPGGFQFPEPIVNYALSPDRRVLVARTESGAVQVWTLGGKNSQPLVLKDFPPMTITRLALNHDGSLALVIAAPDSKEMRVWDLRAGQPVGAVMRYESNLTTSDGNGRFSPDGKWVAAGSSGGEAKVWELATGRLVHDLKGLSGTVRRVDFSPDGSRIVTVELSHGARLWDTATGSAIGALLRHDGPNTGVTPGSFSPNGRWYLTYSQSAGWVRVWDVQNGGRVGVQIENGINLRTPPIFSPDGRRILAGCGDGSIKLWDIQTGLLQAEPMRMGREVNGVGFSPDGRFIVGRTGPTRFQVWPTVPASTGPAPEWLLQLATIRASSKVGDDGETVDVTLDAAAWEKLRTEVRALPADAPYAEWGRWLFEESTKRGLAPGFTITRAEAEARGLLAKPVAAKPVEAAAPSGSLIK